MANAVKEATLLYGPVSEDIPLVGERLKGLSESQHPLLGETLSHVFESGGKRIRPALVMLSGKLGNYDLDRLVTLAASLEVVHGATLVHDDTIDQALTRRGLDTINSLWNDKVAILVGDFLFAQSAYLAAQLDSVRIMSLLSETVMAMSRGELRQYTSSANHVIDEADYFQRIGGKTASLFAMCCQGAAIVSRQDEEHIEALREYGVNAGLAFQIADDVLDFAGDEATLGKPAGTDLLQGTITLPVILLAERMPKDSPLLRRLRNGEDLREVIEAVRTSGVLEDALSRAHEYADAACSVLRCFPPSPSKDALVHLATTMVRRSR